MYIPPPSVIHCTYQFVMYCIYVLYILMYLYIFHYDYIVFNVQKYHDLDLR